MTPSTSFTAPSARLLDRDSLTGDDALPVALWAIFAAAAVHVGRRPSKSAPLYSKSASSSASAVRKGRRAPSRCTTARTRRTPSRTSRGHPRRLPNARNGTGRQRGRAGLSDHSSISGSLSKPGGVPEWPGGRAELRSSRLCIGALALGALDGGGLLGGRRR